MKVWLVNPFDPLPGGQEQLGRYAHLARALRVAGHDVFWWSSTFSHRFKRQVDAERVREAAAAEGIHIHLVPTPAYRRNVSLSRLCSHWAFGRRFRKLAARAARPDIIVASSPPLESACQATRLGRSWGVPVVIDIQDQWPDNFRRVIPRGLRPAAPLLLKPFHREERRVYRQADAIIGVAEGYVQHGLAVGGYKPHHAVFPLGVALGEVRREMERGRERFGNRWPKPPNQIWLLYAGSLSHNYDVLTIARAAGEVQKRFGSRVQFLFTGGGELADDVRRLVRDQDLGNVRLTGFLDFSEWACVLSHTDAGFNASFPDALIYLPNKIFYYLAGGAAVLNTIPGECARLVEQSGCGLNYTAGDVGGCLEAVRALAESPGRLSRMQSAAARLAEERFDRDAISTAMVRFLEKIPDEAAAGARARVCSNERGG